jgi:hypothetical protein
MLKILDLADRVDETVGEIEEKVFQRHQLIDRLNQQMRPCSDNDLPDNPDSHGSGLDDPAHGRWIRAPEFEETVSVERSSLRDLFELVTCDLTEIKSAATLAQERLCAQVSVLFTRNPAS